MIGKPRSPNGVFLYMNVKKDATPGSTISFPENILISLKITLATPMKKAWSYLNQSLVISKSILEAAPLTIENLLGILGTRDIIAFYYLLFNR